MSLKSQPILTSLSQLEDKEVQRTGGWRSAVDLYINEGIMNAGECSYYYRSQEIFVALGH